jgi:ATP-dependent RNA helicase RhlB
MSLRVSELAYEHMNNPQLVQVEPERVTAERVRQLLYHTSNDEKIPLLLGLMKSIDARRSIVFVNTKRDAERVWAYLEGNGYGAAILSGDVPQRKRQSLLKRFQDGELAILVATDVAARGLHIPDVSHVFNYDLPQDAEDYVHRIGRTARLGADGDAISFACERFVYSLPDIEAFIGHAIPVERVTDELLVEPAPPVMRPRRKVPAKGRPRDRKTGRSGGRKHRGARG